MIIAFCGQPRSGKTTIAQKLKERGVVDVVVEGEEVRDISNPGFTQSARKRNMDRAQFIAAYLHRFVDLDVALCLVAPYRHDRETFQNRVEDVHEVYLRTDDVRGLEHYHADHFQSPEEDFIEIDTGQYTPERATRLVQEYVGSSVGQGRRSESVMDTDE